MTNKQTIDGVSREKIQRAIHCILNGTDTMVEAVALADELRALLDKEVNGNSHTPEQHAEAIDLLERVYDQGDTDGLIGEEIANFFAGRAKPATQPLGEVERLRDQLAELVSAVRSINRGKSNLVAMPGDDEPCYAQRKEWVEWVLGLCDAAFPSSAEPSAPKQKYPNRLCHADYTAHPYICGCLKGDEEAQRRFDEYHSKSSAEPKPRGEAVAFVDEDDDGLFLEFIYGENGNPLRCGDKLYTEQPAPASSQPQDKPIAWASPESLGGIRWRPQALDGLADGAPLYCCPNEQSAPLAIEAAKAFAKGFNTLESGGGKYRINMQFQSREDAWGAFNVLARLKQLNTPQ